MTRWLTTVVLVAAVGVAMTVGNSFFKKPYSEKRLENFVLSVETPISIGHGLTSNLSASTELIDVLVEGDVHFRVPRNYISDIHYDPNTKKTSLISVTLFPNFLGVANDSEGGKRLTPEAKALYPGNVPRLIRMVSIDRDYQPEHEPNEIVFSAEKNEPEVPWKYGLLKSLKKSFNLADVYFKKPTAGELGYVVFVSTDELGICNVYYRLTKNTAIQYQFHRDMLSHWLEIHQKTLILIQSFIVKEAK